MADAKIGKIEQLSHGPAMAKGPSGPVVLGPNVTRFSDEQFEKLQTTILLGFAMSGILASGKRPSATPQQLGELKDYVEVLKGLL